MKNEIFRYMSGAGKHYTEWGNPDPGQMLHALTMCAFVTVKSLGLCLIQSVCKIQELEKDHWWQGGKTLKSSRR